MKTCIIQRDFTETFLTLLDFFLNVTVFFPYYIRTVDIPLSSQERKISMKCDQKIRHTDMCSTLRAMHVLHTVKAVMSVVCCDVGASHSAIINLGLWGSDIVCAQYN